MEKVPKGSITDVAGFSAAGVHCGLKPGDALDLAMLVSERPCRAAAVFTTNRVKAAPVLYDQALLARNPSAICAVVVNSGNANAVTGDQGLADARRMAELTAETAGCEPGQVWVMSTGVIGQPLDMAKISAGITRAASALSLDGGHDAARAIMTTDTVPKEAAVRVRLGGSDVVVAGMAKGAGMIHPNLATMLAVLATDAAAPPDLLDQVLRYAVDRSFNCITVDGDTSTNDTVLLLANGASGVRIDDIDSEDFGAFRDAVTAVATTMAQKVVRDGEGATKFITIHVRGAPSADEAKQVAMAVAHSPLVKTALHGEDANWGRVLAAVGYSDVEVDPGRIGLWFAVGGGELGGTLRPNSGQARGNLGELGGRSLQLVRGGRPHQVDEVVAAEILAGEDIDILIDLGIGDDEATVWTCDLSAEYVRINAHYRT
ncbi:MAG: bifunctional glutamate N-acetyltransferase/amino-acid acetyltransferase ArgJ [Anaerolineae bacterium]